tara:strand:- start:4976 stop:5194 length:219 start_codon:yes stop_codon:yes gene_type:complete
MASSLVTGWDESPFPNPRSRQNCSGRFGMRMPTISLAEQQAQEPTKYKRKKRASTQHFTRLGNRGQITIIIG